MGTVDMDVTSNDQLSNYPAYCQVLRFKDSSGQTKEMVFPRALDLDRPKRPRTTFSEGQLGRLETEFQRSPYLVGTDRTRLAKTLALSETQIKVWFQNRRTKCKRTVGGSDGGSDGASSEGSPDRTSHASAGTNEPLGPSMPVTAPPPTIVHPMPHYSPHILPLSHPVTFFPYPSFAVKH